MPLYLKDKKATLFKGEYKPVSLYLGDKKITGYEYAEQTGEYLDFEGTYDDTASVVINGKSEQVQTVQGKNVFDVHKNINSQIEVGAQISAIEGGIRVTGTTRGQWKIAYIPLDFNDYKGKSVRVFGKGVVNGSGLGYVRTGFINAQGLNEGGFTGGSLADGSFSYTHTIPAEIPEGAAYFAIGFNSWTSPAGVVGDYIDYTDIMITTDLNAPYEPFVPDSPSPDYPSPINSVEPFDLVSVGNAGQLQSIHFPHTLRSLPDGTKDYIEINHSDKTAKLVQTVGVKSFNGSDPFSVYRNYTNTISRSILIPDAKGHSYNNDETRSNSLIYKLASIVMDIEGYRNGDTTNRLYFRLNKSRLVGYEESWTSPQISSAVNTYFANDPWIFHYKLAIPTITSLDYEIYKVLTYYPYTQIYTNAEIQPTLEGKIRIIGNQNTFG